MWVCERIWVRSDNPIPRLVGTMWVGQRVDLVGSLIYYILEPNEERAWTIFNLGPFRLGSALNLLMWLG